MECLEKNEICLTSNKKCKNCMLDDCKNTMLMLEEEEKMWFMTEKQKFEKKLEKEYSKCLKCPHLIIEDMEKGKVRCFYRIKDRCVLNGI